MPNFQTHCAISMKRTQFDFAELHDWMDNTPLSESLGPDHRLEHHTYTKKEMETIRNYWERKKGSGWGEKAVVEWLFHIAIDNLSTAFKFSQTRYGDNTYNHIRVGLARSGFIHVDFDRMSDSDLSRIF